MRTFLLIFFLTLSSITLFAQETKKDTVTLNRKNIPHDTLEPFDRSSNKHIEIPNPNRPPSNATPISPKKSGGPSQVKKPD